MTASVRALLANAIDYAGLFPPASLSLDESIRSYARYLKDPDRWMLGKFVCPAAKLSELAKYFDLFDSPLQLSVLGSPDDLTIRSFVKSASGRASADAIELKVESPPTIATASRELYLEFPWDRTDAGAKVPMVGLKLRTGGVEAKAFPSPEIISHAIIKCRDASKHMKFTAGLHHPIRHFNKSVNTKMHGFINVFVAGVLASAKNLDESKLVEILSDEDAKDFSFEDDGLKWRDQPASIAQIEFARKERVISFGSCSFDEPRDDLRALGWL